MTITKEMKTGSWSDEEIEYLKNHFMEMSHEDIGKEIGRTRNAVRSMCSDLKLRKKEPKWTKEEEKKLAQVYKEHENKYLDLDKVAEDFGRSRYGIAMKASRLGFADLSRQKSKEAVKEMTQSLEKWHQENEHPRGMLGKKHTEEYRKVMSINARKKWADPNSIFNSEEYKIKKQSANRVLSIKASQRIKNKPSLIYSNAKWGKRSDLGDYFFRSRWEANMARYLNHLKETNQIYKWEFESQTFKFSNRTERPYSYTPDFKIWKQKGDTPFFYEVKGWMDDLSKKKLELMKIEFSHEKIELIDEKKYSAIEKQWGNVLPHWEKR